MGNKYEKKCKIAIDLDNKLFFEVIKIYLELLKIK